MPEMTKKEQLMFNATRWMELAKKEGIKQMGIGAIFMFFDLSDPTGSAICVGSVNREAVKDACKGILKKLEGGSLIINPFEKN
jgi:hypothetical protein